MFHKTQVAGEIHQIHNFSVADSAALTALGVTASDIGKVAAKIDDASFWVLASVGPNVWKGITPGASLTNPMTSVGDIIYGGTVVSGVAAATRLGAGVAGTILTSAGPGAPPTWAVPGGIPNLLLSDYTWVNQSTATAVNSPTGRIVLTSQNGGTGDSWNILKKTQTLTNGQTVRLAFRGETRGVPATNNGQALVLRDSATGKLLIHQWQPFATGAGGPSVFTSATAYLGTAGVTPVLVTPKISATHLQITYDSTLGYSYGTSYDGGINWYTIGPAVIASFAPTEIGFAVNYQGTQQVMYASRLEVF